MVLTDARRGEGRGGLGGWTWDMGYGYGMVDVDVDGMWVGRHGMGWDGMGWNGMGWGPRLVTCYRTRPSCQSGVGLGERGGVGTEGRSQLASTPLASNSQPAAAAAPAPASKLGLGCKARHGIV